MSYFIFLRSVNTWKYCCLNHTFHSTKWCYFVGAQQPLNWFWHDDWIPSKIKLRDIVIRYLYHSYFYSKLLFPLHIVGIEVSINKVFVIFATNCKYLALAYCNDNFPIWKFPNDGFFTIKSAYPALFDKGYYLKYFIHL